ncbi:alpha/beta fold hydrolase [Streptomyces brasiliensis]|uniref:Hydrolase, alpha/beta fold protein n=1 Tax=Streptomyces brasiliensis TaxID=1954 RepID=A0A917UKI8_9ACTN|nr:alpha/beta fold hydrolase [Streptomyces brasiliensis]GGJ64057.1 putative hydrolase, alpha/beta fold protein [Streptomyces brasiliensis]
MTTQAALPTMREALYDTGRQKIFVAEAGDGPAVLLLHGGGPGTTGRSSYVRNIAELAEGHRVIVPDLPGYGRSSKGVDPADPFGHLADGVRGLLDRLGLDRVHLVGHSYGGACALRLALDTPGRVDRMVLVAPGGIGTTRALPTPGVNRLLDYYKGDGPSRRKLEEFIRQYLVHDDTDISDAAIEERYRASLDPEVVAAPPLRRPSGRGALRTIWRMDLTRDPRLARLAVPTLVVWGTADKVNRPSGGRMLAGRMSDCDLYLMSRTGHWAQYERAGLFNRLCAEFLTGRR